MKRFNKNDRVVVDNKQGKIINMYNLIHFPTTIYQIQFDDGSKQYHFFLEIKKA